MSAINHGTAQDTNWYIEFERQFPSKGHGYWKEKVDGGFVTVVQTSFEGLGEHAPYRWVITKDHLDSPGDKGVTGPSNLDPSLKSNRAHFVMKDDDGITYYEGEIYGDYDGFEPLDDFGMPNAGATSIWYGGKPL